MVLNGNRLLLVAFLCGHAAEAAESADRGAVLLSSVHEALAANDYEAAVPRIHEAVKILRAAGAAPPVLAELHFNLIVCYQKVGNWTAALETGARWLKEHPDDAAVLELLAKLHYHRGRYNEAADAFQRLSKLKPLTPRLARQIARVQINRRSQNEAVASIKTLLKIDQSTESLELALDGYLTFFQEEKALDAIASLRALEGDQPVYRYAAGIACAKLGRRQEAEKELAPIVNDPVYGDDARYELSLVLGKQRDRIGEAVALLAGLLERDPYNAQACFQLSQLLLRQRRREEAKQLRNLHKALAASEEEFRRERRFAAAGLSVDAVLHRAVGYQQRKQFRKAEETIRSALQRHPEEDRCRAALGNLLVQTYRFAEAERVLRRAESTAQVRELVGLCLRGQGKIDKALGHFRACAASDPRLAPAARVHMAQIYMEDREDPERALECLKGLQSLNPSALLTLTEAHFARGAYDEAAKIASGLAAAEGPTQGPATIYLAWCAVRTKRAAEAARFLDQVRGPVRGSGKYFTAKAEILEATGDAKAPQYRQWETFIKTHEEKAQRLVREIADLGWPEASEKLVKLAENAKALRQQRQVYTFSMLAAEADPNSVPALRLLLTCPLFDFMKLSVLVRLARLAPDDSAVAVQIVELREKYGLTGGA